MCQRPHWPPTEMTSGQCEQALGNGEIRVRGADGTLYAAPSLIAHYIAEHSYLPPGGFIEAIHQAARTAASRDDSP
jgi:hypothetical protein